LVVGFDGAASAGESCTDYVLDPAHPAVAAGGALFTVKNTGDKQVVIDPAGAELAGGEETTFIGDPGDAYQIKLANPDDKTTVHVCLLG